MAATSLPTVAKVGTTPAREVTDLTSEPLALKDTYTGQRLAREAKWRLHGVLKNLKNRTHLSNTGDIMTFSEPIVLLENELRALIKLNAKRLTLDKL